MWSRSCTPFRSTRVHSRFLHGFLLLDLTLYVYFFVYYCLSCCLLAIIVCPFSILDYPFGTFQSRNACSFHQPLSLSCPIHPPMVSNTIIIFTDPYNVIYLLRLLKVNLIKLGIHIYSYVFINKICLHYVVLEA